MKNTLNYFLVLLVSVFTACSDSDSIIPDDEDSPANSYWPLKIGNRWNLVNTEDDSDEMAYYVHKTVAHDGDVYYQFQPIGLEEEELTYGVREEDGVFYELHGAIAHDGNTISAGTITSMNMNLNVGQVWKDEMTLNITGDAIGTVKHVNEGKILEKADNVTVNGKTYKNVIKTSTTKTITNSIAGYTMVITYESWLAKGVGLIYEKTTYGEAEEVSYGLVDYVLK